MANYNSIYTGQQIDAAVSIANSLAAWAKGNNKPTYSWSEILNKPSWIGSSKPSYSWDEIGSKPSWIGSSKPSYNFSEIETKGEEYLDWGPSTVGKAGLVSPIGMALSSEHSANRIAFLNPNAVTLESSTDNGSTWYIISRTDNDKINLCTLAGNVPVGPGSGTVTTNYQTRITLCGQDGTNTYVYTSPKKLLIRISSPHTLQVTVQTRTGNSTNWNDYGTYRISGWSGWNDIPLNLGTFGGGTSQTSNTWYIRLVFKVISVSSAYSTTSPSIMSLRLFGDNDWTTASSQSGKGSFSNTGHLYSYDANANATFPKKLAAKEFIENETSLSSKYLALSGGTMTGTIKLQVNTLQLKFRELSGGTYDSGIVYRTLGNEAVCFENNNSVTSWIFRTNDPNVSTHIWNDRVPSLQIKNKQVAINKLIPDGGSLSYNLDVNGTMNATTIYENETAIDTIMDNKIQAAIGNAIAASY